MPPQQSQQEMSPDEAKAALGIATSLQEQMMAQMGMQEQPQEGTTEGEMPQGEEQTQEPQKDQAQGIEELKSEILQEIQTLREEVKAQGEGSKEITELKKKIEDILNETD